MAAPEKIYGVPRRNKQASKCLTIPMVRWIRWRRSPALRHSSIYSFRKILYKRWGIVEANSTCIFSGATTYPFTSIIPQLGLNPALCLPITSIIRAVCSYLPINCRLFFHLVRGAHGWIKPAYICVGNGICLRRNMQQ